MSHERRLEAFAHDLRFTSGRIHAAFPHFFPSDLRANLWADLTRNFAIVLNINLDHPQEGLWRLSLQVSGSRIFSICFSILPGPEVFIGGVQGGRSVPSETMLNTIREATKAFEGLRPHFLLFDVMRTLAATWDIKIIHGISSRHQLKVRSSGRGSTGVRFSYDGFFKDLGAVVTSDGLWAIPTNSVERKIADVPSRKRAMYRRRRVLLDQLRGTVGGHWKAEVADAPKCISAGFDAMPQVAIADFAEC